eukprot:6106690-Pyramimonas_sp.AAC.1
MSTTRCRQRCVITRCRGKRPSPPPPLFHSPPRQHSVSSVNKNNTTTWRQQRGTKVKCAAPLRGVMASALFLFLLVPNGAASTTQCRICVANS